MARDVELSNTQRTFLEKHLARDRLRDPAYVAKRERSMRKRFHPPHEYDEEGNNVTDYSDAIAARKEACDFDRRRIEAEIAAFANEYKPELVHKSAEVDPLIKAVSDAFRAFYHAIRDVAEDDHRQARADLLAISQRMHALQVEVEVAILGWVDPEGDDAPVELWSADLGKALKARLPRALEMIEVPSATASLQVPRSLYDLFVDDGDLMTPAQIQHEATGLMEKTLDDLGLGDVQQEYDRILAAARRLAEQEGFEYEEDEYLIEVVFDLMQDYIDDNLQERFDTAAADLATNLRLIGIAQAERAEGRVAHMKHRKRRIAAKAAAPIIGVAAGSAGVILGAIGIAATPATAGVSGVAGAGIALASIATLRASAGGIKLLYERTRSLDKLTKGMHKDIQSLINSYSEGGVTKQEVGGTIVNSVFVGNIVKTFPRIAERFALIEERAAKVSTKQIQLTGQIDQLLKDIQSDRAMLSEMGVDADDIEAIAERAEARVAEMIENVIDMGAKITDFTTTYGRARVQLTEINSMIGSKTATATQIIPVLTEFAFLITNASVGVAGVAETTGAAMQAANATTVLVGEIGDGLGAIDAAS